MKNEEIIRKFKENAVRNNFFIEKRLCDLKESCSKSKEVVVDYDYTKNEIQKTLKGYKSFESCDALKIGEQVLNFIEMKSIDKYLKNYTTKSRNKFMKKDFGLKYSDSVYVLGLLLKRNDMDITIEESGIILDAVKSYIVLIDREFVKDVPEEFLFRLQMLQDISYQEEKIYEEARAELTSTKELDDKQRFDEVINKINVDLKRASERMPKKIEYSIMSPSDFENYCR